IVGQHDEAALDQVQVDELIVGMHPGERIVAARRDNAGKWRPAGGGNVKIAGDPEVGPALEHDILDAVAVTLVPAHNDWAQRIPLRVAVDHLPKLFTNETVAGLQSILGSNRV